MGGSTKKSKAEKGEKAARSPDGPDGGHRKSGSLCERQEVQKRMKSTVGHPHADQVQIRLYGIDQNLRSPASPFEHVGVLALQFGEASRHHGCVRW